MSYLPNLMSRMFTHIRTSRENKELVTELTRKYGLGSENHIARIALSYSLSKGKKISLDGIQNSAGKEYSQSVLFGEHGDVYIGMICTLYGLYINDKDVPKYIKAHLDDGLLKIKNNDTPDIIKYFLEF